MPSRVEMTMLALVLATFQTWAPGVARAQEAGSRTGDAAQPQAASETTPIQDAAPVPEAAPMPVAAPVPEAAPAGPVAPASERPAAAPSPSPRAQSVLVTGSRIRRPDGSTASPVKIIGKEQIQASGKLSIGDFLQTLVVQSNAVNTAVNDGNDGSTSVNLRGLSSERTLVLVNGRRVPSGGTRPGSAVDLGSIPTAAVERIEVLADGASAVYGADAIGGVVNLITRADREGTEVSAATGISGHGDGAVYDLSLGTGAASDWGSFAVTGGFYRQDDIMAGERAFSSVARGYSIDRGEYTYGSSTTSAGTFHVSRPGLADPSATAVYNDLVTANPTTRTFVYDSTASQWRPFGTSDVYNSQAATALVTPQQRVQLYATGDAKLGDFARAYVEASYVNRRSEQLFAADPLNTAQLGLIVSSQSMYNPFGVNLPYVRRRLVEAGGRRFEQDIDTWRVVAGVGGSFEPLADVLRGWAWDVSLDYGRSDSAQKQRELKMPSVQAALGPSAMVGGKPTCLDSAGGSPITGCVPLDLLHGPGSITSDQLSGILYTSTARVDERLLGVQAGASGGLFTLAADRPVALAFGYEYRGLSGGYTPDPYAVAGETTGGKGEITSGSYHANEGYAELSIPIVSGAPGVEDLEAMAAARLSGYDSFGLDWTYQLGLRWKLIPDVTLRGTYSTAYRAPSISDLYSGQGDDFALVKDPCRLATGPASCGSALGNGDVQSQLRSRVGGNPYLQPETAKIFTVGVVVAPTFVEGLSLTVDYYRITMEQLISTIGESVILQSCYPTDPGTTPKYCDLITRDPSSHFIINIMNLDTNVGSLATSGIDFALRYALATEVGRFGFGFDANWLHAFDRTLPDGAVVHGKGTFDLASNGLGGVYPAVRFDAGVSYGIAGLTAAVNLRYVGSFDECGDSAGEFDGSGRCFVDSRYRRTVGAYQAYDLYVSYQLGTRAGRTTFGVGVDNVLDREPERIYNGSIAASDPTAYDFMGRYVFGRIVQTF